MVTFMLNQPESRTTPTTRYATSTWARSPQHEEFARRFGVQIYTAYGMTEVPVPIVSELEPGRRQELRPRGRPVHYELRLVDENDIPVPPGTPGELVARHTLPWTINSGYKNMPAATAEAWRNGWFHTGDQFTQDEHGNFYFLDRIKDVIRRRGENISSFEVETEVLAHPLVKDVAAIAVENPDVARGRRRRGGQGRRRARGRRGSSIRPSSSSTSSRACPRTGCRASSSTSTSCRGPSRTSSRRPSCARRASRSDVGPDESTLSGKRSADRRALRGSGRDRRRGGAPRRRTLRRVRDGALSAS